MQIPILVEPIEGNTYRARGGEPFGLCAAGASRDEAVAKLKEQLQTRLSNGAELVTVDLEPQNNPWLKRAGMFKDDPYFQEVIEIMKENRRKMDENPEVP